ncbi:MAG: tetratricopeptide repeat protein, partial [Rhodanobacteraceae bacterium]
MRAQQYIADGQTGAARAALESVLRREPEKFAARMLLASVHLSEGRVREAASEARLAAQSPPDDPSAVAAAAQCLIRIGEMTSADACLSRFDVLSRSLD